MVSVPPAPVRLSRVASRQRTRQALVSAAMAVIARDGYAGASVDAIAAQAGYTVGAVYSNFASKEGLFLAVFERHCEGEVAALQALVDANAGLDGLLRAVTERFAVLDDQQREWWRLWGELWLHGQRHPEAARRLAAVQAKTRTLLAEVLAQHGHRADSETVAHVHALWIGFMMTRLVEPATGDVPAFGRAVRQLVTGQTTPELGG